MPKKPGQQDSMADLLEHLARELRARGVDEAKVTETVESVRSSGRPPTDDTIDETFPVRESDSKVIINVTSRDKSSKPPKSEEQEFTEKVRRTWSPVLTLVATLLGGGGVVIGASRPADHGDLIYQVMREENAKLEKRIQDLELNARTTSAWNLAVLRAQGVQVQQDTSTPEPADVKVQVRPAPPSAGAAMPVARVARGASSAVVPAEVNVLTPPPVPPAPQALDASKLPATLDELARKRERAAQGIGSTTPNVPVPQ